MSRAKFALKIDFLSFFSKIPTTIRKSSVHCREFPGRCQEVLEESEKLHNKPVADSPLTLAEVTGFMAMEVKLQSSLTEQNAKFIKV